MTQDLINQPHKNVFNAGEGTPSILTLFNLLPDPAIIFQPEEDNVLAANNAFFLMTNLGEDEFLHQSVKNILPDISDTNPISGHNKKSLLKHKKQSFIPVTVKIFPLDPSTSNLVLILKPEENLLINPAPRLEHDINLPSLMSLLQTREEKNIDGLIMKTLEKTSELLNTQFTCVYKISGTPTRLDHHGINPSHFLKFLPDQITENDIQHHQQLDLWTPGNPILSSIHQAADSSNIQFLISIPLLINGTLIGLFITASLSPLVKNQTILSAQLIAANIANQLDHHHTSQYMRSLTNKIRQVVKIQNEIIENLEEGVIILSPDLTIAEINPATETILGYANNEALRQPVESILIGSKPLGSALRSALQGIPTSMGADLNLHHRSGRSFPAQVMMSPVMRESQIYSIIILIRDLSQQQQNQASNQQLEQRAILGEVSAIFAHEVRNPINAIMLSLQVIEENINENDPNRKWIENMRDECHKLLYLMDSVLSFARPLEFKMADVDLQFLLENIINRWHPRFSRLNILHYFDTDLPHARVEGDLRALEQVFTNLISNSVNAMSESGGSLGLKISGNDDGQDQEFIQITITDTGPGIPDEIKEHMFKPFVTGSSQGTGLGLAITQRIINAHKGKIEVDSFPGGTIFRIFLRKSRGTNLV